MPTSAKSVVIHAAHDLRIQETHVENPGPGQVLIQMAAGGICGSDLHYYSHGGFGAIKLREPMILGHEVSGHIVELGAGVSHLAVGQLVAVSPSRPCLTCAYCLSGAPNHCLNMRFYGSAMPFPHIQGAFRELLVADASQCAPAGGLTAGEAAMGEPLAVVLHALHQAGDLLGKSVLVTGCGPIGTLAILAARRAGAAKIIATDLADFTLGVASQVGADQTLNMAKTPDALAEFATDKGQIDVHFECSGAAPALAAGVTAVRAGGTIVQLGLGGDMTIPMQAMTAKEITLKGSFRFHREFFTGITLMQKGLIDVKPLITHSLPMDQAVAAFNLASDRTQAMKAQLVFGG